MSNGIVPAWPANAPAIRDAKLPAVYESAKNALAECSRIDECQEWADKAAALASYAKQADDKSLQQTAERIRARAIRRCGELLQAIEPAKNQHDVEDRARGGAPPSRKAAAEDAGLSRDQAKTAIRVASVPAEEFESQVEADDPPTVTELAEQGKRPSPRPLVDLQGREPHEFTASTNAQARLRDMAQEAVKTPAAVAVRGALPHEWKQFRKNAVEVLEWAQQAIKELERME